MLRLKLQHFGNLVRRVDSLERPLCLEGLGAGGEGDDTGWDGWMASLTRWTWVWVNSGSWWWTGEAWCAAIHGVAKSRTRLNDSSDLIWLVLPYINMNPPPVYTCSPPRTLLPPPSPYHPSVSSQCTSPKHPVSCIEPGLVIHFIYDIIHVSVPLSQIIPPSPSPTESKRLFYTFVSLLLSRLQGYRYHLSKFHIYALVYCIGVFLSGLLHSV